MKILEGVRERFVPAAVAIDDVAAAARVAAERSERRYRRKGGGGLGRTNGAALDAERHAVVVLSFAVRVSRWGVTRGRVANGDHLTRRKVASRVGSE